MSFKKKPCPDLSFERAHRALGRTVVGVDEVGRGCLAGPVVTAAVVLPEGLLCAAPDWLDKLNDSKLVRPADRERLAILLWKEAEVQVGWCDPREIDQWNILHAALIAMRRALVPFSGRAQTVLVDGNQNPFDKKFRCPEGEQERLGFTHVETLVKGDQRSMSIAAASIVAKVYRDSWMSTLDSIFPGYSFGVHKGYSTPAHYEAIRKLGGCALHRKSFEPFKSGLNLCNSSSNGKTTKPHDRGPGGRDARVPISRVSGL